MIILSESLIIISKNMILSLLIKLVTFLCSNLFFRDNNSTLYCYQLSSYYFPIYEDLPSFDLILLGFKF